MSGNESSLSLPDGSVFRRPRKRKSAKKPALVKAATIEVGKTIAKRFTPTASLPVIGIVVAGFLLCEISKNSSKKLSEKHKNEITDDVLDALTCNYGERDKLKQELIDVFSGKCEIQSALLRKLVQVECTYEKRDDTRYTRSLAVRWHNEDDTSDTIRTITRDYDYEYLPDEVRGQMIKKKTNTITVRFYPVLKEK